MTTDELIQQLCAFIDEGKLTSRSRELARHAIKKLADRLTSETKTVKKLLEIEVMQRLTEEVEDQYDGFTNETIRSEVIERWQEYKKQHDL